MTITSSCSWCHEANPISERFCLGCGHEAHKPRGVCRCEKCAGSPWGAGLFPGAGVLAAAVVAVGVMALGPRDAEAHSHPYTLHDVARADSNGYVIERYVCNLPDGHLGRYLYRENGDGTVDGKILYDSCNMSEKGAGPKDWRRVRAHERAHARGLNHWQGTPETNPAYYPNTKIYGS